MPFHRVVFATNVGTFRRVINPSDLRENTDSVSIIISRRKQFVMFVQLCEKTLEKEYTLT